MMDLCDMIACGYNREGECAYSAVFGVKRPCKPGAKCDFYGAPSEHKKKKKETNTMISEEVRTKLYKMQDEGYSLSDMKLETNLSGQQIGQILKRRPVPEPEITQQQNAETTANGAPQVLLDAAQRVSALIATIRPEDSAGTLMGFREACTEILHSAFKRKFEQAIDYFGEWGGTSRG